MSTREPLNNRDFIRYSKHICLDQIGKSGQEQLKNAKVLVVGSGGLGCPVLQYLGAAGIGTLGIIDDDIVEESNLQRQVLFDTTDIGKPKALVAAEKLRRQNPLIQIIPIADRLQHNNALEVLKDFDIVIDGSDNFPTRYLVNDACVILKKPLVFGSIFKFEGQISVFNYRGGPTYRCLFPEPPNPEDRPNCSEIGVLGVLPGLIGTLMASECIKIIIGIGEVLNGKLLVIDMLHNTYLSLQHAPNLENYKRTRLEEHYDITCKTLESMEQEITVFDLHQSIESGQDIQILDVREPHELEICKIDNSTHIPLGELPHRFEELSRNKQIVTLCHHGVRSHRAMEYLKQQGFERVTSLKGGIHEWASHIDQSLPKY